MTFKINAINIGKMRKMVYKGKEIQTGIYKMPVEKPLHLTSYHFQGDEQADLVHHGGKDKAVCVYPYEHYHYWEKHLQLSFDYGAFGENLTTSGLIEEEVCIGDTYQLGEAIVQVSQPRQPCYKLAQKHNIDDLALHVQETGFTGFYFRVIKEGYVSTASEINCIQRHPQGITVALANRIMHHDKQNREALQRLVEINELSSDWKGTFLKRLTKTENR